MIGSLKKRADFLRVQSQGQKWVSKTMIVQILPNEHLGLRFGLTITKRVFKSAVDRNRVKRRLRHCAHNILETQMGGHHMDVVLIGRKETLTAPYTKIEADMRWCLKRLEVVRPREKNYA